MSPYSSARTAGVKTRLHRRMEEEELFSSERNDAVRDSDSGTGLLRTACQEPDPFLKLATWNLLGQSDTVQIPRLQRSWANTPNFLCPKEQKWAHSPSAQPGDKWRRDALVAFLRHGCDKGVASSRPGPHHRAIRSVKHAKQRRARSHRWSVPAGRSGRTAGHHKLKCGPTASPAGQLFRRRQLVGDLAFG